jgi:tripartite motif-containing protein 71
MGRCSIPAVIVLLLLLSGDTNANRQYFLVDSLDLSMRSEAGGNASHSGAKPEGSVKLGVEPAGVRFGVGELREPLGLSVDVHGFVYVADAMTGKVFRYSPGGESVEFERPSLSASLYPIDVAVYGSYVYVLDYAENRILRYDREGSYLDILLSFSEYERMHPVSITIGRGGRIVTTDIENQTLTIWTPLLDIELSEGEFGWAEGSFDRPMKAVIMPDDRVAIVESGNRRVQLFSPSGRYESILSLPEDRAFRSPRAISADQSGNIFVADAEAGRIFIFSTRGEFILDIDSFESEAISPAALAVGWNDLLYVADLRSRSVLVYHLLYPS